MTKWVPSEEFIRQTRIFKFMEKNGFNDYKIFYERSVTDLEWFWKEVEKELEVPWLHPYEQVLDDSNGIEWAKWFVNGKLNAYDLSVEKWVRGEQTKQNTALIWEGENAEKRTYTYESLAEDISKVAAGLKNIGIKRGDIVAIYLPMIPETIIAMMAISKIGAVFTPIFSGYGAEAIATRISASGAKLVITADGYYRRGKVVWMKDSLDEALLSCPEIKNVVVIPRIGNASLNQNWLSWDRLLTKGQCEKVEAMNSDEALMLIYTSGTTGKPKGTVHTHAGFPIKAAFDAGIGMDLNQGEKLFWLTDMGWMMGPFLVYGGLINGATIVLYEGSPDFPFPDRLWELLMQYQISHLGISPTLIRALMKHGDQWLKSDITKSLRVVASTGEPWNDDSWLWLFEKVGKEQIPIFNYTGGTEISGGILGNMLIRPITPSSFNAAIPGMSACVYDDQGKPVEKQVGELVLTKPWVGMTNGFWKQPERYLKTYWNRWPQTWVHGDWAIVDQNGYYKVTGRSDDTMNVAGKRIGPSEIETVLTSHPFVHEAGVIGVPDEVKGDTLVCFVLLKNEIQSDLATERILIEHISKKMGKALRPKRIHFISELPKTKNGKVMRRILKNAYLQKPLGDVSAIENKDVLSEISRIHE